MILPVLDREYKLNETLSNVAQEALIDQSCYSLYVSNIPNSSWWHVYNKVSCVYNGVVFGGIPYNIETFHMSYSDRLAKHFKL